MLSESGASPDMGSTEVLFPCSMLSDSQPEILHTTRMRKAQDFLEDSCPRPLQVLC